MAVDKVEGTEVGTSAAGSMVVDSSTTVIDISTVESRAGKDICGAEDSMKVRGSTGHPNCQCSTDLTDSTQVDNILVAADSRMADTLVDSRMEGTLADSKEEDTLVDNKENTLVDNTAAEDNSSNWSHNALTDNWDQRCTKT